MSEKDEANLLSIIDAVSKIEQFTSPFTNASSFYLHAQAFDATLMNFIVIGESVKRLSGEIKQDYPNIEWKKIAGFRDIVAHNYFGVDANEIWEIINENLLGLKEDVNKILKRFNE